MGFFSISCASSVGMALYITAAMFNLYRLMYPLAWIDMSTYAQEGFVKPLWEKGTPAYLRVYISTLSDYNVAFLKESYQDDKDSRKVELLWDELVDETTPSFCKSFLLTTSPCTGTADCQDESYMAAMGWLDQAEQQAFEDGVLSVVSGAGQGIESTSILLSFYASAIKHTHSILSAVGLVDKARLDDNSHTNSEERLRVRSTLQVVRKSPLWRALQTNSTIFAHVVLLKADRVGDWPPSNFDEAKEKIVYASRSHSLLLGSVNLVKHELPNHVKPPTRILSHDLVYIFKRYILQMTAEQAPWDMKLVKPDEYAAHVKALKMKDQGIGYPYWKPMMSVKYVNEVEDYPLDLAHLSGMPLFELGRSYQHPTGFSMTPSIHVDEIGLTSGKFLPINGTVTSLPLRLSFDRSDIEHSFITASATAGGISPARWRLLSHLSHAIESQKALGFDESDIDEVRRLIADTNVTLLAITLLASALHLLFEFLTFKNEVSFWNSNKDLTGLSVRSLFLDVMGQAIVLLYLIERESSLLITIPSGIGLLIAMWKCQRASGLRIMAIQADRRHLDTVPWWNKIPRLFGFELRALRLERYDKVKNGDTVATSMNDKLHELTIQSDKLATRTLGVVLFPAVVIYALYSLASQEYTGWYSWLVTTASSAVYALGFVLMTPQLFLNYKLKSVAHLPWRVLGYKFVNTFIDDLFSFVIRMPTMARISCFRDDVVFFVYLYQRLLYPVDASRPVEGVDVSDAGQEMSGNVSETKKKMQ